MMVVSLMRLAEDVESRGLVKGTDKRDAREEGRGERLSKAT